MSKRAAADVTVVVPARNEQASLGALLDALLGQSTPPAEIIVVDAGSSDHTAAVAQALGAHLAVRVVRAGPAHPGTARNIGAALASTPWLAFIDAGTIPPANWLQSLRGVAASDEAIDVVYGSYEPRLTTFIDECAALAFVAPRVVVNGLPFRGPTVASLLVRKSLWAAVDGFPAFRASEDLIFLDRIAARATRPAYAPRAAVLWDLPRGFGGAFRRFTLYSEHNLAAGRGRNWHLGVLRLYLLGAALAALCIYSRVWLAVLAGAAGARVLRYIWTKRRSFDLARPLHPARWPVVGAFMLVVDAATFWGSVRYSVARARRRPPSADISAAA